MNLEYDADEESLLAQAAEVFRDVAPLDADDSKASSAWARLVEAGWSELGASVEDGSLSLGLAAGVFRLAGRQLLVEQFVSTSYLLAALVNHAASSDDRHALQTRLNQRPGVLLGDGRVAAIPVVAPAEQRGFCFGIAGEVDVYRVVEHREGSLSLGRWNGSAPAMALDPPLSRSVGRVLVDGDSWLDSALDLNAADLARIEAGAALLHSAALVGCAEQLLLVTRDYTLGRVQFGSPIGSYQAVKHALADVFTANTVAWNAILSAAAEGADTVTAPLVARFLSVEAALGSARAGAQFHGGMGYTAELNVHHFLKTVLDGGQRFGCHDDLAVALSKEFVSRAC